MLINKTNSDDQPHHYSNINDLIKLEETVQEFSRSGEYDKIDFYQNKELPDDFLIFDHKGKNTILFFNVLNANSKKLNMATQIIRHWLFGETLSGVSLEDVDMKLSHRELDIFFKGSVQDIIDYRYEKLPNYKHEPDNKPISVNGWKLYHYDANFFENCNFIKDEIEKYFAEQINKYNNYSFRISYGIVSKAYHLRTNKKDLINKVESFLDDRGFDTKKPFYFNDYSRNGEPILLWVAKNHIGDKGYKAAVGINFGFDNGVSGFKFGIGLYLEDENLFLNQINRVTFKKSLKEDDTFSEAYSFVRKAWTHHQIFGELIEESKKRTFKEDNLIRIVNNTHKHLGVSAEDRTQILMNQIKNNGANKYSLFTTWLEIAEKIEYNNREKSLAEFVASCVLGTY